MLWTLILIAVHSNDPKDIPGIVELQFQTQNQCISVLDTLKYDLKFKQFVVKGTCEQQSIIDRRKM